MPWMGHGHREIIENVSVDYKLCCKCETYLEINRELLYMATLNPDAFTAKMEAENQNIDI